MALRGGSWAKVVLVVVLVAVVAVPTSILGFATEIGRMGTASHRTVPAITNGLPVVQRWVPSSTGPGNVTWTLCLMNNTLLTGNVGCPNGTNPNDAAYDSGNGNVYVANEGSNNLNVISGNTNTVIAMVSVGVSPWWVAYDSGNGNMYVANEGSDTTVLIDG